MKTNLYKKFQFIGILMAGLLGSWNMYAGSTASPWTLNCPPNVTVSCTDELWDLSIYGNATYTYGYYTYSAGTPVVQYYLNSCNTGYITRTWTVEDNYWQWRTCTQTIYVSTTSNGTPDINWPDDIELEGCNPNTHPSVLGAPYDYPTWTSSECSMLGTSYSDKIFTVNSQCKKVMRTWKVLDWCNYTQGYGYAIYTHNQIIKIISSIPPVVACVPEITTNSFNCKNAVLNATPLVIDPSTCGGQYEITNNSPYATAKGNDISGVYPIGTTKVKYTIKYGCGNITYCNTNVVVKNGSTPTPYCIGSLITTLMPVDSDGDGQVDNGMVDLWAKDLDRGSKSSCGYYPLKFSFYKDSIVSVRTFTCDHIGKNYVDMWVTDAKGAQSKCRVEVIIQNNGANIPNCHPKPDEPEKPLYTINGKVITTGDKLLENACVTLTYDDPIFNITSTYDTIETLKLDSFINHFGYKLYRYVKVTEIITYNDTTESYVTKMVKTNVLGKYLFDSLTVRDKPVTLTATYNDSPKFGIDNKDVELLTSYLLGEINFSSYYQFLASDINEDGAITIEDQNLLMQLLTDEIDTLPGANQWYLLDAKADFAPPISVLEGNLPYAVHLDSIAKDSNIVHFIAIKKGNISVDPNTIIQNQVSSRSNSLHTSVKVQPNPFTSDVIFTIQSDQKTDGNLTIFTANGQLLFKKVIALVEGENNISVDMQNDYKGMLYYQINTSNDLRQGTLIKM